MCQWIVEERNEVNTEKQTMMPRHWVHMIAPVWVVCAWLGMAMAQDPTETRDMALVSGTTWHVALDGSGHFLSIQEAIDHAQDGDTIFIKAGHYTEDVTVHSKEALKVIGEGREKVYIAGLKRVGTLHIGKWPYGATNVEISGLTIQQHGGLGVGIFNGEGVILKNLQINGFVFGQQVQKVRIENCVVGGSETTGIAFADSQATLVGNVIHDNDHGVSVAGTSTVHLEQNIITRSLFEAVLVADQGQATLMRNTLVKNGGGVRFQDESTGQVEGNIIDETKVGIAWSSKNTVSIAHNGLNNNNVHYRRDGESMGLQADSHPFSSVYAPPRFVAPTRGDYRLQADSPFIRIGGFPFLGALAPIAP